MRSIFSSVAASTGNKFATNYSKRTWKKVRVFQPWSLGAGVLKSHRKGSKAPRVKEQRTSASEERDEPD
jgi:hypothetical protein